MPWNLLVLLPLVGAYAFVSWNPRLAYGANRLDRSQLIFNIALWAVLLGAAAFLTTRIIKTEPELSTFVHWWKTRFPEQYSGTAVATFLLGTIAGGFFRITVRFSSRFRAFYLASYLDRWIDKYGDELERFFRDTAKTSTLIQLTLSNKKVYIGQVVYSPAERPEAGSYVVLNLYASGFRNSDDLSLNITSRYHQLIQSLREDLDALEQKAQTCEKQLSVEDDKNVRRTTLNTYAKTAQRYLETWDRLNSIIAIIPVTEIIHAMPFDEHVFSQMKGTDHTKV